jgi:hypothetical protein
MKTKRYTAAMLIGLVFGLAAIQAQPARRTATPEKKERATVTRSHN